MRFSAGLFFFLTLLLLAAPAKCQNLSLYFGKDKVVQSSAQVFDYKEPINLRVVEGMGGGDVSRPFLPALLCDDSIRLAATLDCYQARSGKRIFWDDPQVELVDFEDGHQAALFNANLNYSGSGAELLWALLVLDHSGIWKNLLPEVTTSNQSDHLFWHLDSLSKAGFFSLADGIWSEGEEHYGAHRYTIQTYEFCSSSGKYVLADEFITRKKFASIDASQPYVVVRPMLPEIQRRLSHKPLADCH